MATRSPRPSASRKRGRQGAAGSQRPQRFEDVAARAARLGITPERVLIEYARIAFADMRHIVEVKEDAIRIRSPEEWADGDAAAVSEFVPGADPGHSRVKLYDKKAALDAIARHLGMFPAAPRPRDDAASQDEEKEDPRDFLARKLARLAAGAREK